MTATGLSARLHRGWSMPRILFLLAGTVTLASVLLAVAVSPWFLLLTAFTGLNQLVFVALGDCPASLMLRRCGLGGER
jgi:hypothetical protein